MIAAVVATPAPIRHLVYAFSWESQQTMSARDSANPAEDINYGSMGGSGISRYRGSLGDRGTITVDVLREQPDSGLVVVIGEQGLGQRNASPATCVAYGITNVLCDPNATVNPEEYTLLRFLGTKFVDPTHIDDKGRWFVDESNNGIHVKAAYHIDRSDGHDVQISEVRDIVDSERMNVTTQAQTSILYDPSMLAPMHVDEYVTQHEDDGVRGTTTTTYQTTLRLESDSLAKSP
jgi:hypothetical protein